jgi:hypothetical protein
MKHVLKLFLTTPDLVAVYPDFATLAERALVLPPTSVDPERGASALKRLKRKDRSRATATMLDAWMMISIEGPEPGKFDSLRAVVNWYCQQPRRVRIRWIEAKLRESSATKGFVFT